MLEVMNKGGPAKPGKYVVPLHTLCSQRDDATPITALAIIEIHYLQEKSGTFINLLIRALTRMALRSSVSYYFIIIFANTFFLSICFASILFKCNETDNFFIIK